MSPVHGLLTVIGVLLTGTGAYFLGRWWETRVSDELRSELDGLRRRLEEMAARQQEPAVRESTGWEAPIGPQTGETVVSRPSGDVLEMLRSARGARVEMGQTGFEGPPAVTLEMDADAPDTMPRPEDLTKRISMDSADEMLELSHQVDVLTEDVSRLHRELAVSRARIVELEDETALRKRKNAELERRVEQLKGELRRRDDKLKALLAEVGIKVEGAGLQTALEGLTARTKRVDISELEEGANTLDGAALPDEGASR